MHGFGPYAAAIATEAFFAFALWLLAWLNADGSATCRTWAVALIVSFGVTDVPLFYGVPNMEAVAVFTDVALGLVAGLDFCFNYRGEKCSRPLWLVGLLISYIAQLMFHANDDNDKAFELNVAFAVQILLVASEPACQRLGACLQPLIRPLMYSHGAATRLDRAVTRGMRGPNCRPLALRRALERASR